MNPESEASPVAPTAAATAISEVEAQGRAPRRVRALIGYDAIALLALSALHLFANLNLIPAWWRIATVTKRGAALLHSVGLPAPATNALALMRDPARWLIVGTIIGLAVLYLVLDLILRSRPSPSRHGGWLRATLFTALLWFAVGHPLIGQIWLRANVDRARFAHDGGVLQTEIAALGLLEGQNPYGRDYSKTPMARSGYSGSGNWRWMGYRQNPALRHYPYLPLTFLAALPGIEIASWFGARWDQRGLYALAFLALIVLVGALAPPGEQRRLAVALVALNPLLIHDLVRGYSDILGLALLVASLVALRQRRIALASALLGAACATKPFAWLVVPFFVALWLGERRRQTPRPSHLSGLSPLWPGLVVVLVLVLPFCIWDLRAFVGDIFAFNAGTASLPADRYPIRGFHGYGLAAWLLYVGAVDSVRASFPFVLVQVLVVAPILWFGGKRLLIAPRSAELEPSGPELGGAGTDLDVAGAELGVAALLGWSVAALALFFVTARFLHLNYLTYLLVLATTAIAAGWREELSGRCRPRRA
ncbi:MAG: hypothetical protein KC609_20980 [Myxococcales bacterium]|nr:hypothetical protein [Myxococcales bacterium]